jgi:hypothetical protein
MQSERLHAMILNLSSVNATAIDFTQYDYSVNLQISWARNQTIQTTLPNMLQYDPSGVYAALFPDTWLDEFDPSIVRNVSLPALRSITGVATFGAGNPTETLPGAFHIIVPATGQIYSLAPTQVSEQAMTVVSFALPIRAPLGSGLLFGRTVGESGFTVGNANVCVLTYDVPSFIGGN